MNIPVLYKIMEFTFPKNMAFHLKGKMKDVLSKKVHLDMRLSA